MLLTAERSRHVSARPSLCRRFFSHCLHDFEYSGLRAEFSSLWSPLTQAAAGSQITRSWRWSRCPSSFASLDYVMFWKTDREQTAVPSWLCHHSGKVIKLLPEQNVNVALDVFISSVRRVRKHNDRFTASRSAVHVYSRYQFWTEHHVWDSVFHKLLILYRFLFFSVVCNF